MARSRASRSRLAMKPLGKAITRSITPKAIGPEIAGVSIRRIEPTSPTGRASASSSRRSAKYSQNRRTSITSAPPSQSSSSGVRKSTGAADCASTVGAAIPGSATGIAIFPACIAKA